jgi:hypothetical protein
LRGNSSFSTKSPKASNHANLDGWKDKSIRSKRSIPTFQTITLQFLVLFAIATHFSKPFGHHGPNDLPGLILTPKNSNMPIKEKVRFHQPSSLSPAQSSLWKQKHDLRLRQLDLQAIPYRDLAGTILLDVIGAYGLTLAIPGFGVGNGLVTPQPHFHDHHPLHRLQYPFWSGHP